MKFFKITLTLFILLGLCGCSNTIRMYGVDVNPRPNIDLPPINESIALELGKEVKDTIYDDHSDLKYLEIYNWRETLKTGFTNAFKGFKIVDLKDNPQLILKINRADPSRTIGSIQRSDDLILTTALVSAQMVYSARLINAEGEVVKRSNGTVHSKKSGTQKYDSWPIMESLIESMYEKIAKDFFQTN